PAALGREGLELGLGQSLHLLAVALRQQQEPHRVLPFAVLRQQTWMVVGSRSRSTSRVPARRLPVAAERNNAASMRAATLSTIGARPRPTRRVQGDPAAPR